MTGLTSTFFLIYCVTNVINGKIYIGKHKTSDKNDSYMGSGKMLHRAFSKYGIEHFKKEILFECSSEEEMNAKEAEIVNEEFVSRDDTYNICSGGQGGWSFVNSNYDICSKRSKTLNERMPKELRSERAKYANKCRLEKISLGLSTFGEKKTAGFTDKQHSSDTKMKMSIKAKERLGEKNSQFGSIWINNGFEVKKIKGSIPDGWNRGRKF